MTAEQQIWQWVWLGFYTPEEILEMVMEETWRTYFDYKTNADTLETQKVKYQLLIAQFFNKKNNASTAWKSRTDVDRLENSFEELRTQIDVVAVHLAGRDYDEAIENIGFLFEEIEEEPEGDISKDFCFYLENDINNMLPPLEKVQEQKGNLPLYFGQKEDSHKQNLRLGEFIFKVLKNNNFKLNWSKKEGAPIIIQDFEWQNRGENWEE
ncbi:MAG: DUF6891 domain-containing protein [Saprospiraceae bacterium]